MPLMKNGIVGRTSRRTLAASLNKRCSIQRQVLAPTSSSASGKFSSAPLKASYETIVSVWCGLAENNQSDFVRAIRGTNTVQDISHYVTIRSESIKHFGPAFAKGFTTGFKTMDDINSLDAEYFVLLETAVAGRGRRLKIIGISRDEMNSEFTYLKCCELREAGTGHGD